MPRTRWQYLRISYYNSYRNNQWVGEYTIWRGSQSNKEVLPATTDFDHLLDQLGGEGWEQIETHTRSTVIVNQADGFTQPAQIVSMVYTFKRPVDN